MTHVSFWRLGLPCLLFWHGALVFGAGEVSQTLPAAPVLKQFCFECHGDKKAKAQVNLRKLSSNFDVRADFKTWEKVLAAIEAREMPPEDEAQLTDSQRTSLLESIQGSLDEFVRQEAGDPGRIALRRLTSAEYAYSIEDLTGLDLGLERTFMGDAVGGEGFSNVGDVQFVQDSTIEHYLNAAKLVAGHAIVGAGPLRFSSGPGKTGQELAAMRRIKELSEKHGFRTASGEGGNAYGLDHYPRAFYAAWRFKHRSELGLPDRTLASFAQDEGLDAPFVEHIFRTLEDGASDFPGSAVAASWRMLPAVGASLTEVRTECEKLYHSLRSWQQSFAENTGDAEVASLISETSFRPSLTNSFRIRMAWPPGRTNAAFRLFVQPITHISGISEPAHTVVWRDPALRFRLPGQPPLGNARRGRGLPLKDFVSGSTKETLRFGDGPGANTNDFVTTGAIEIPIEFAIPPGSTQAEFVVQTRLAVGPTEDALVRCRISHDLNEGATVAANGTFALLLANPAGAAIETLKDGVARFARAFPQVSHREAAPADRDPIPAMINNDYNNAERNEFHASMKYYRDDRFLSETILGPEDRRTLDQSWTDLLTSFDYHQLLLNFLARKHRVNQPEMLLAHLSPEKIEKLPDACRPFVQSIFTEHSAMLEKLRLAEPGHLEDALRFAESSWRRPLDDSEKQRLRSFYETARQDQDHPAAMRSLISRILVAPSFLYRIETRSVSAENRTSEARIALSDWELASRLSYFLWGSIPDAELRRAAALGELKKTDQLADQASRMLRDPKARRFATEFFGQWFGFYRFNEYRGVDTTRFSEFSEDLREAMYDEAVSFFEHIVRNDRPVDEVLFADYSFLNPSLAEHYGMGTNSLATSALSKVDGLGRYHRGGLLRLGAVLTSTSAPLRTSAVKRGDWLLRRVLGKGVPPPPGDAGSIPPDDVLADGLTVRQRLESHRRDASCVNCHARIDPFGFALEHFDSIGRWRDTYRDGQKIDASGRLSDGTEISEFDGLIGYLKTNEILFQRTLCAKLLGFALGRAEAVSDRPLIEQMVIGLRKNGRFSALVTQIVSSPQFRYRRAVDESPSEVKEARAE